METVGSAIVAGSLGEVRVFRACSSTRLLTATALAIAMAWCPSSVRAGGEDWAIQLGGPGPEVPYGLAVSADGGAVVVGTFLSETEVGTGDESVRLEGFGSSDIFIASLTPAGELAWARRVGGPETDEPRGVAIDGDGSIYLTGFFIGSARFGDVEVESVGGADAFLAKFSPAGETVWVRTLGGKHADLGAAVAMTPAGPVLAGRFQLAVDLDPGPEISVAESAGASDSFVAAFDPAGTLSWARSFGGERNDEPRSVAVAADGRIAVLGTFENELSVAEGTALEGRGLVDLYVVELEPSGSVRSARALGGPRTEHPAGVGYAGDRLWIAGSFQDELESGGVTVASRGVFDLVLAGWGADGSSSFLHATGGASAELANAAVTVEDGLAVAGFFQGETDFAPGEPEFTATSPAPENADAFVARYDADGTLVWARPIGGPGAEQVMALAAAPDGTVTYAGVFNKTLTPNRGGGTLRARGKTDVFVGRFAGEEN